MMALHYPSIVMSQSSSLLRGGFSLMMALHSPSIVENKESLGSKVLSGTSDIIILLLSDSFDVPGSSSTTSGRSGSLLCKICIFLNKLFNNQLFRFFLHSYLVSHFLSALVHTYSFFHFFPFLEFFRESLSNCANSELLSRQVTDKKFGLLSCQSVPLR